MLKHISLGEKIFYIANYVLLVMCVFLTVFPLLTITAKSLSSVRVIESGKVFLLPMEENIRVYKSLIMDGQIIHFMFNTVIITLLGTVLNMFFITVGVYVRSKKRLLDGKFFLRMVVLTMMFSGGIVSSFLLVKSFELIDTCASLWLLNLITAYNLIVLLCVLSSWGCRKI